MEVFSWPRNSGNMIKMMYSLWLLVSSKISVLRAIVTGDFKSMKKLCKINYNKKGGILWNYTSSFMGLVGAIPIDQDDNIIIGGYKEENVIRKYCIVKYGAKGEVLWNLFSAFP